MIFCVLETLGVEIAFSNVEIYALVGSAKQEFGKNTF
jgi:hypothetical protein